VCMCVEIFKPKGDRKQQAWNLRNSRINV